MPAKDAEHRREYMRLYMAQKRKAAKTGELVTRKPVGIDFIGPPCPANLPDRPIDPRQYAGQVGLLKAQLAHTLQLWQESSEDLLLQVEMLQVEDEALQQAQPQRPRNEPPQEAQRPRNEPPKTLPAPPKEPPDHDIDQYLRGKAQGFVDPDRKPTPADDHIPDW